jgi:tetratricopeptide (TPR) repeat protein
MIWPLIAGLLLAPQSFGDSGTLALGNDPNEALLKSGQYFRYVRAIEQKLTQTPSDANLHASLALGYFLLGQRRFSEEEIQEALKLVKTSTGAAQVHYLAGRFAMESAQHAAAVRELQTALTLDPQNSKIEYFLGVSLEVTNQRANARAHFQHACSAGAFAWPCRALAEMELDDGNPSSALEHALKAVQMDPASAEARLAAGKSEQALGNKTTAISYFRKAAELDLSWEIPHFFLANLYQKMPDMAAEAKIERKRFEELYNASQ